MSRPVLLGIVGDSGSGKTTIARGLVRVLGHEQVTHFSCDAYHRYDRRQRPERGLTPLSPECNYLDILTQDLAHLRRSQPVLTPTYRHSDGTFGPPAHVVPGGFIVAEGLLAFHTRELRDTFDVRVFVDPPEELRRRWKVARDCSRRGYTTDQVLAELDRREHDAKAYIRPQQRHADIVISFRPGASRDPEKLDAHLFLRDELSHPDLSAVSCGNGIARLERPDGQELRVAGAMEPERVVEIEELIWSRMHFASHMRQQRLGEFTIGTGLYRSDSLAIAQLLVLLQLVTARATVALGGSGARLRSPRPPAPRRVG